MATLEELIVTIGADASDMTSEMDQAADNVTSTFERMRGPAALAGGAAAGALAVGFESALDMSSANATLGNQLDLTEQEAERAGDVAGTVFRDGFGESIGDVNQSLNSVVSSMGELGDFTDTELESMTSSALTLADTFGFDVAEGAAAAGQLLKTGLADSGEEAFDLLTSGAQRLPQQMASELPSVINEYSANFDQLGLSGDQMFGMISSAAEESGWSIDQAADAVRELGIRVMNNEAPDAIEALGFNADDMAAKFSEGGDTAQKATEDLWGALNDLEDPMERQQLGAELFGSMWEDSGEDAIMAMDPAAASMDNVAGSAEEANEAMESTPAQQMDSAFRTLSGTLGEALLPFMESLAGFAEEHPGLFKALSVIVLALAIAFGVFAAAVWATNLAMMASPITWIVLGIIALIAVIVLIIVYWDQVAAATAAAWAWIKSALAAAWAWIKSAAQATWDWIGSTLQAAWDWIVGLVMSGVNRVLALFGWLSRLPGRIGAWFSDMVSRAASFVGDLVSDMAALPGRIMSAVGDLGSLLWDTGRDIIRGLIDGVSNMIGSLQDKFASVTSMIPDWKGPRRVDLQLLTGAGEDIMSGLTDGIEGGLPGLRDTLQGVTRDIPSNVDASVRHTGGQQQRVVIDVTGGDDELVRVIRRWVRESGGGDVASLAGR